MLQRLARLTATTLVFAAGGAGTRAIADEPLRAEDWITLVSPGAGPAGFDPDQFRKAIDTYVREFKHIWVSASEPIREIRVTFGWRGSHLVTSVQRADAADSQIIRFRVSYRSATKADFYRTVAIKLRGAIQAAMAGSPPPQLDLDDSETTETVESPPISERPPDLRFLQVSASAGFGSGPWAVSVFPGISLRWGTGRFWQGFGLDYGVQLQDRDAIASQTWRATIPMGMDFELSASSKVTLGLALAPGARLIRSSGKGYLDVLLAAEAALRLPLSGRVAVVLGGSVDAMLTNTPVPVQNRAVTPSARFLPRLQIGLNTRF